MPAQIETRYPECGFVYTDRTRMMFAPKFLVTRNERDKESTAIAMCTAANWADPNKRDIAEIRAALIQRYPDRELWADAQGGMVPIYHPPGDDGMPAVCSECGNGADVGHAQNCSRKVTWR